MRICCQQLGREGRYGGKPDTQLLNWLMTGKLGPKMLFKLSGQVSSQMADTQHPQLGCGSIGVCMHRAIG